MFDDLVEAQFWLRSLVSICGRGQAGRLGQAADELDAAVAAIAWSEQATASSARLDLPETIRVVGACAREDLGGLPSQLAGGSN
ncbi:hypothetical protein ACIF83_16995 [Streptomyces sp. NPDC085866]|uniref:hypothetical protein n=1 Tax=Streptomyces sp. NPDC085866 TaxID=3365736 RepID=UPI0037D7D8EF